MTGTVLPECRRSSLQAEKKLRSRHFEVLRNRQYADDCQVSLASFNAAHVRSVKATDVRKLFLRPSSPGSKLTNALAHRLLHCFVLPFRFSFSHLQSVSKYAISIVYRSLLDRQLIAYSQMTMLLLARGTQQFREAVGDNPGIRSGDTRLACGHRLELG